MLYSNTIYIVVYNTISICLIWKSLKATINKIVYGDYIMSKDISMLNVRIKNDLKKELKLIAVYEDTTVSDVVIGFLEYGVKVYNDEQRLINKK